MPIHDDLINEISGVIGNLPSNLSSGELNNVYEVYIFTLILKAAQNEGGSIRILDQNNNTPTILHFRSGPGYITSNRRDYSFAEILFNNKPPLEVHVSIRISGHSHVLHEGDVCVLYQSEANLCRRSSDRVAPRSSKVILNIEAKYYTTPLALGLGRGFLGLITDFSSKDLFFVTNTTSSSVESLLAHKRKDRGVNIIPGNTYPVNNLIVDFQKVFTNFKAKIL